MEKVRGFIYNEKGEYYGPIYLERATQNIARFIARAENIPKVIITDMADIKILDTIGNYVDTCTDQEFLADELLPVLVPMQQRKIDPYEGDIVFDYNEDDYPLSKSELKEWVKKTLNYIL